MIISLAMLYPISVEEFRQKYYRKKALLIKSGDVKRFNSVIEDHLFSFK